MKTLITLVMMFFAMTADTAVAVEEAKYTVALQQDKLEIRDYEPSIVAEVVVDGSFEEASNTAFRTLFNYISGDNTGRSEIAMTAPVSQQAAPQKIAMTAPVGQRRSEGGWAVSFMMPASYTMETIPLPNDPRVALREVPAYRAAAIRYSGTWSEKSYRKHLARLMEWMAAENLEASGEPVWARYNAPFVPWFMRRNEILVPIHSRPALGQLTR
jgi:effector-binding domain-containing protein